MTRAKFKMTFTLTTVLCLVNGASSLSSVPTVLGTVKRRDHKALTALIKAKADVNVAQPDGATALAWAIYLDDQTAAGADPNTKLPDGSSVLIAAAAFRSSAAGIALIDGGADVKVADRRGNTPLHTAAQLGDLELVKKLLAKGADSNARNAKTLAGVPMRGPFRPPAGEVTPLHVAARANQLEIVKALLAAGADPKVKGEDGTTILMQAAGSANVEMVKLVFELDSDMKAVTQSGGTIMHAAVTGVGLNASQPEICKVIRFLAEKGAPLDERNAAGRTPIDIADILLLDQAVDLLTELIIKSGAKPKTPTKR